MIEAVDWPRAIRIISTRHPPIDLFETDAPPEDWELLARLESRTNPRVMDTLGNLSLVPTERRVSGAGASYVMAPFLHVSPAHTGRFHDGTFGAYYAAREAETALAETMHHRGRIYRAAGETPGWIGQFRELTGRLEARLHRVTKAKVLDPDDYSASQELARQLRAEGADGVFYDSVRHLGGQCAAAFWPDVVGRPVQTRHYAYHFDGQVVDMYRDIGTGEVFRRTGTDPISPT